MKEIYGLSCCIVMALVQSMPAWAQDAQDTDGTATIDEITITAQRREESVQKASVPISVLSSEQLRSAGTTQVKDLAGLVPGVQVGQQGAATQIYIRGVGDTGTTPITNPAVAFSVDGVSIGRSSAIEGHFHDIQRVEVLKGPQGTLYGRNASGGAVNVITNKPILGEHSAHGNLEVGNYQKATLDGAVNLPLSATTAIRGAFQLTTRDGFLSNGWDDQRQQSARLQLLWQPDDQLSIVLGGDYTHVGGIGGGAAVKIDGKSPWTSNTDSAGIAVFNGASAAAGQCVPTAVFPSFALYPYQGACPTGFTQLAKTDGTGERGTDNHFWGVRAQLDYELDFATLTVIPAYRSASLDYTLYPTFEYNVKDETSKQTSVEARLGQSDGALKWVIGGFFYNEAQTSAFDVLSGSLQNSSIDLRIETRSYAAFGQATYSISDPLRVIAGLRYTSDRRELGGTSYANNPGLDFLSYVPGQCTPIDARCVAETFAGKKTFRETNWRAGMEFDLSPSNMLYATAATGFKAGGFSANLAPTATVTGPTDVGEADSYKPETLLAYELGSRNRFFNNRLQLNLEAFLWKYDDHQENRVTIDSLGNVAQTYINAGKATQYGLSTDLIARLAPNDTLTASVEYLHSIYDSFTFEQPTINTATGDPLATEGLTTGCSVTPVAGKVNTSLIDCSGRQLNKAAKWTANASYVHRFVLPNGGDIEAKGSMNYVSARWLSVDFLPSLRDKAHTTFDAVLAYRTPNSKLSVRAFVRNITNEPVYNSGQASPFVGGFTILTVGSPRTYGMGLSANF